MKTGMNLLLWTTHVTPEHDAILDQLKSIGFDAVEVPIFDTADLAPFERLGKRLKSLGLGATAVTVMGPETNPISPDPKIRAAAVAHLDRVLECGQAFGCEILCGPTHSAIGVFSGEGPTEDEFKYGVETLADGRREGPGARHQDRRRVPEPVRDLLPDDGRAGVAVREGRRSSLLQDDVRQLSRPHRGEEPVAGDRRVCRRDDSCSRFGKRPRRAGDRAGGLGWVLQRAEAERL